MKKILSIFFAGFLGSVSGILSSILLEGASGDLLDLFFRGSIEFFIPGIIFGFVLALFFVFFKKPIRLQIGRGVLFIIVSVIAWSAAFLSLFVFASSYSSTADSYPVFPFLLAGFIGGAILLFGVHRLYERIGTKKIIIGALIASVLSISALSTGGFWTYEYMLLFVVWQTGVAFYIGYILSNLRGLKKEGL